MADTTASEATTNPPSGSTTAASDTEVVPTAENPGGQQPPTPSLPPPQQLSTTSTVTPTSAIKARPLSTTSSQLSISDRMTDGDDEDNSSFKSNLLAQASSSCSSSLNAQPSSLPPSQQQRQSVASLMAPTPPLPPSMARTTTISTIAMESNTAPQGTYSKCSPTRLVLALLQTPHRGLQLKVIELSPPLLKLPDNLADAEDFLQNHTQVIKNLQSKQSPVEELLRQADNLIATQKPRAEVYAAMAESLGLTWKDLNAILEERRVIIHMALNAHQNISACLKKMDEVHATYSRINYFRGGVGMNEGEDDTATLNEIRNLKNDRTEILRMVSQCLESCDQLLNKIAGYNYTVDSRELVLLKDVEYATRQVQRWLERLHDRRIILEEKLRNKRDQLEEYSENFKYKNEIADLSSRLEDCERFLREFNFGDSAPSTEQRREGLSQVMLESKALQERGLSVLKRVEDSEYQRARFTQRASLKNKIFEILGQTNDLITEAIGLEASLLQAKEFFVLAQNANESLESFCASNPALDQVVKSDLNKAVNAALSQGEPILTTYGWDSPKTKGVRAVYDTLRIKKEGIVEQLDHLAVLDQYNKFLESVNQTYQNILNIETSLLRQEATVPTDLESLHHFKSHQEKNLQDVSVKLGLETLMTQLHNIFPSLSEEEKQAAEAKINEFKALSNTVVQLLVQRVDLSAYFIRILEIYHNVVVDSTPSREKIKAALEQILQIQHQNIKPILDEIHQSDRDLITDKMETEIERIIKELKDKLDAIMSTDKVREICQKYKVKLDHHLLGDGSTAQRPSYYPVLSYDQVTQAIHTYNSSKVQLLKQVINTGVKAKLENTLSRFFQPLITSYRQEVFDAQSQREATFGSLPTQHAYSKTQEEADLERYCDRLKESYVTVTKEIESYLTKVLEVCQLVEDRLNQPTLVHSLTSAEEIEKGLEHFDAFREQVSEKIRREVVPRFDHLLETIRHEEPPREGEQETNVLQTMMAHLGHDEELNAYRDQLTHQIATQLVHKDLELISQQLNQLLTELDQPANYGNTLKDATDNMLNYEQFERTAEALQAKLNGMLQTSIIPETDEKAATLRAQLTTLSDKRAKRKNLINHSLRYFKLIETSYEHYEGVNKKLDGIRDESKRQDVPIYRIEELIDQVIDIKNEELKQEERLSEINSIANIIFPEEPEARVAVRGQQQPFAHQHHSQLIRKNLDLTDELARIEADLKDLLNLIKTGYGNPPSEHTRKEEILVMEEKKTLQERLTPSPQPPASSTTTTTIVEHETISVMSTIRRSVSPVPLPPPTPLMEQETQVEDVEVPLPPPKIDRDTVTQTMTEKISTSETQTEGPSVLSPVTVTAHEEPQRSQEVVLPICRTGYDHPIFIHPLKDFTVNEGERVVLECRTTGNVKRIVWLKNGMEVTNNPDYLTEFKEGSVMRLTIEEVFHEDSAIFTCRAVGEDDTTCAETSGKLTIREPSNLTLQPPKFLSHSPISTGTQGKPHCVKLSVEGNPLPTVSWFKNGQCIDTSPDYIITFNNGVCQIQFDELLKELDAGIYSCVASNQMGESETHVELQVKGDKSKKLKQTPRIVRHLPKCVMSRAGQPLKLQCEFDSPSECNVLWWKDDSKILNYANSSAHMKTSGNLATLTFNEAYPADCGKYTVLIRNSVGECQSECNVTVKGLLPPETSDSEMNVSDLEIIKPIVKMSLKDSDVEAGSVLKLDCVIVGQPEPEVIWYKNGTPIKESPNRNLIFHGDRCTLVVKSASAEDAGSYSVVAVNSGGEVTCSCKVAIRDAKDAGQTDKTEEEEEGKEGQVIEPPTFSSILHDEMVTEGEAFKFFVELGPTCDKSTQVAWFKNNQRIEPGDGIELVKDGTRHALEFKECKLSDKGNYQAKATNAGGDAKCFACLIVKENIEKKSGGGERWEETVPEPRPTPLGTVVQRSPPVNRAPRFIVPLDGKMVDEGEESVSLCCILDSSPPAKLNWTKNNGKESLLPCAGITLQHNEKTGDVKLTFGRVSISDAGRYCLTATNDCGMASSVCDVIVKKTTFPPVFSKRLQSLTLDEDKRLYLEIDVFGKPAPEVLWYLNGNKIEEDNNDGFVLKCDTPTRHSLIVAKVNSSRHGGEYKAVAMNEVGEAASQCVVNILQSATISVPIPQLKATTPPPPPVPPKPKLLSPSPKPDKAESLAEVLLQMEPLVTTQSSRVVREVERFSTLTTFTTTEPRLKPLSPVVPRASPLSLLEKIPQTALAQDAEALGLEPGPEPEILVALSPVPYGKPKTSRTEFLAKIKTYEEQAETPVGSSGVTPPSGGVRIIPIKAEVTTPKPSEEERNTPNKFVEIPIQSLPLLPFPFEVPAPSPSPQPLLAYEPKQYFDTTSSSSKMEMTSPDGTTYISNEHKSFAGTSTSSDVKFIRPSKFFPEKMRESDYDSELDISPIPTTWLPPLSPIPKPYEQTQVPAFQPMVTTPTTTSAFVACKPGGTVGLKPIQMTSTSRELQTSFQSISTYSSTPSVRPTSEMMKPAVPPKPLKVLSPPPRVVSPPPPPFTTTSPAIDRVRQLVKSWPPQESPESEGLSQPQHMPSYSLPVPEPLPLNKIQGSNYNTLSPASPDPRRSARSPTPNREALEMDKLWSRPIRFSSPTKFSPSPLASPPPLSPGRYSGSFRSPTPPPLVSPKPQPSFSSPLPSSSYSSLPLSRTQPSQQRYFSPVKSSSSKEALYYVSTVSTPRTTPTAFSPPPFSPPPFSPPLPDVFTESRNFHEKKEFFEKSASSYSEEMHTSSRHFTSHQSSSASSFSKHQQFGGGPPSSSFPLIDSSMLPPPGDTPEFLYAAPPPGKGRGGQSAVQRRVQAVESSSPTGPSSSQNQVDPQSHSSSSTMSEAKKQFLSRR